MDDFLYSIPKTDTKLTQAARTAVEMAALSSRLVAIERTRCAHPDNRAENDAEHSLMLAKVAPELAYQLYPKLDEHLVARFATLHDDVEAYVGDTPTDTIAKLDQQAKADREAAGLQQLLKEYGHISSYTRLVEQYEAQSVPEARFVRAVDKLMVLLIHMPNSASVLQSLYSQDSFLKSEAALLERDGFKYGEFDAIKQLRVELGTFLAQKHLS